MNALTVLTLAVSLAGQTQTPPPKGPPAPVYRYIPVPPVTPGSGLYAYQAEGGGVMIAADVFAFRDMVKSVEADDGEGLKELNRAGRLWAVKTGTAVRVLQSGNVTLMRVPAYEVRVLDGGHAGRTGWVAAVLLRDRVEVPAKGARRRRR